MNLIAQARAIGLAVFPCWTRFNTEKNKYDKGPSVPRGVSWKDVSDRPDQYPTVDFQNAQTFGIKIPDGVVVIDEDQYKGASRAVIEEALGGPLDWEAAKLQKTISGGNHYAFSCNWHCRQGDNIAGIIGFDTRCAGRGFIISGDGYEQAGNAGIFALAHPGTLPRLPDSARAILEVPEVERTPAAPTEDTLETKDLRDALRHIDPAGSRESWLRVGLALRSAFADDEDTGLALFDEWSRGDLQDGDVPHNYVEEHMQHQWASFKSEGGITAATVFFEAIQAGWVPPRRFDASAAFGADAAPMEAFSALVARIHESGSDATATLALVSEIQAAKCNFIQRDLLVVSLKAALKDAGLLDKKLSDRLDAELRPDREKFPQNPPVELPDLIDVTELEGRPLLAPTAVHGQNALAMERGIFGHRVRRSRGRLHWWSGREWQHIPEETLDWLTYWALMPDQCKTPNKVGTIAALKALVPELGEQPLDRRVFFRNCIVDAETGELSGHVSTNANRSCLSVDYDPSATCPEWTAHLASMFDGLSDGADRVLLLQEIIGYALFSDLLNVQKISAFDGASRGGKGVSLEVMRAIIGSGDSGEFTFSNIGSDKTQSSFRHHRVMVDSEAKAPRAMAMKNAATFVNKLASNEPVSIELLHTQSPWVCLLYTSDAADE